MYQFTVINNNASDIWINFRMSIITSNKEGISPRSSCKHPCHLAYIVHVYKKKSKLIINNSIVGLLILCLTSSSCFACPVQHFIYYRAHGWADLNGRSTSSRRTSLRVIHVRGLNNVPWKNSCESMAKKIGAYMSIISLNSATPRTLVPCIFLPLLVQVPPFVLPTLWCQCAHPLYRTLLHKHPPLQTETRMPLTINSLY